MKKEQKISLVLLAVLGCAALVLAAGNDLAIDQALYSPSNPFAIVMEAFCYWPLYLPFTLLGVVWGSDRRQAPVVRIAGYFLFFGTLCALSYLAAHYLKKRQVPLAFIFAACCVAIILLLWAALRIAAFAGCGVRARLAFLAKSGIALCLAENVVINLLKLLWTRMRYDDMVAAGSFDAFTAWWQWGKTAGNTSFPSGHTAGACGILILLLLPMLFRRWRGKELTLTLGCYAYIALTGFARIVIGRHFLSDTIAAAFVVSALYFGMTALPFFKSRLSDLLLGAQEEKY